MSLDIFLLHPKEIEKTCTCECGNTHIIKVFDLIWSGNITHNLGIMASKAGIYEALWRPDEKGWKTANDIISNLEEGLKCLLSDPDEFKKFNPENGWGSYDILVNFVIEYLSECKKNPNAKIEVHR